MAKLDDIPGALSTINGLPRVDWLRLTQWVLDELPEPEWETALSELTEQWLEQIAETLEGAYEGFESDRFFILTDGGRTYASDLAQTAERALREIFEALPEIAHVDPYRKLACLAFHDSRLYYDYVDHADEVGDLLLPDGGFVPLGREQFAIVAAREGLKEEGLVTEIARCCLFQRVLPLWLEEGVKQLLVEDVLGYHSGADPEDAPANSGDAFRVDLAGQDQHQAFWKDKGLRRFWQGHSFGDEEGGSVMSLELSQVLTANLAGRGRADYRRFIASASPLDGGDLALRDIYGFGLGELAARFLGPGEWDWTPESPTEHFGHALLLTELGRFAEAREHYETAVREEEEPGWLQTLAWFLATCPDDGVRDGKRAVELAKRAGEATEWDAEGSLDTLAAAYAEAGDFDNAIQSARAAIEQFDSEEGKADAAARLALYEEGKPFREDYSPPSREMP